MFRLVLLVLLTACGSSTEPASPTPAPEQAASNKVAASGHGDPNAAPGSHGDWCGEHAVPESQCTRCNHDLVPAFKATGDWCDEHGLPESHCLACNPDLVIERPPKEG